MKATIHFTGVDITVIKQQEPLPLLLATTDTNWNTRGLKPITNTRAELEKLRLEAVIQKEAEEKYPLMKNQKKWNEILELRRQDFRYLWNEILERLPSEEDARNEAVGSPGNWNYAYDDDQIDAFCEGANWFKSKLLPSLPSTLSCEYEEENGKIEIKKIWL